MDELLGYEKKKKKVEKKNEIKMKLVGTKSLESESTSKPEWKQYSGRTKRKERNQKENTCLVSDNQSCLNRIGNLIFKIADG